MESFRSELEDLNNPVVARDIIDLEQKIRLFREGKLDAKNQRTTSGARYFEKGARGANAA